MKKPATIFCGFLIVSFGVWPLIFSATSTWPLIYRLTSLKATKRKQGRERNTLFKRGRLDEYRYQQKKTSTHNDQTFRYGFTRQQWRKVKSQLAVGCPASLILQKPSAASTEFIYTKIYWDAKWLINGEDNGRSETKLSRLVKCSQYQRRHYCRINNSLERNTMAYFSEAMLIFVSFHVFDFRVGIESEQNVRCSRWLLRRGSSTTM